MGETALSTRSISRGGLGVDAKRWRDSRRARLTPSKAERQPEAVLGIVGEGIVAIAVRVVVLHFERQQARQPPREQRLRDQLVVVGGRRFVTHTGARGAEPQRGGRRNIATVLREECGQRLVQPRARFI